MRTKAVSALLATVILVAFTVSAAIIVTSFMTGVIKFQTTSVSNQAVCAQKGALLIDTAMCTRVRDSSLVGYWKMDSVNTTNYTADSSGFGNDGKLMKFDNGGNPPVNNFTAGQIGNALQFDGVDDYVDIGSLDLSNKAISLWVNDGSGWSWLLNNNGTTYKNGNVASIDIPIISNSTYCYQETANVSTSCGGLNTGTYATPANYLYVNYTKPAGTVSALWLTKHGNLAAYNSSIPSSCLASSSLILRFYAFYPGVGGVNGTSYGQCFNNSDWVNVTQIDSRPFSGGSVDDTYKRYLYDGDWNTRAAWMNMSSSWGAGNSGEPENLYEEAMWWNFSSRIGQYQNGTFFNGTIDEVRIYNRSLSADEINQHYQKGLEKFAVDGYFKTIKASVRNIGTTPLSNFTIFADINGRFYQNNTPDNGGATLPAASEPLTLQANTYYDGPIRTLKVSVLNCPISMTLTNDSAPVGTC